MDRITHKGQGQQTGSLKSWTHKQTNKTLRPWLRPLSLTDGQPTIITDFPFLKIILVNQFPPAISWRYVCEFDIEQGVLKTSAFIPFLERQGPGYLFSSLGKWPLLSQKCFTLGQGSFRGTYFQLQSFLSCWVSAVREVGRNECLTAHIHRAIHLDIYLPLLWAKHFKG